VTRDEFDEAIALLKEEVELLKQQLLAGSCSGTEGSNKPTTTTKESGRESRAPTRREEMEEEEEKEKEEDEEEVGGHPVAGASASGSSLSFDGAVAVLTKANFKSEVLDSDRDVLVKFYAPWSVLILCAVISVSVSVSCND
jgi:hypothetical protein